jgi:hypothetical protein
MRERVNNNSVLKKTKSQVYFAYEVKGVALHFANA